MHGRDGSLKKEFPPQDRPRSVNLLDR